MCIYFSFNPHNNSMRLTLVLTLTAITKYNRLGALNQKIFLTVLDAGRVRPAELSEGSLLCHRILIVSLHDQMDRGVL